MRSRTIDAYGVTYWDRTRYERPDDNLSTIGTELCDLSRELVAAGVTLSSLLTESPERDAEAEQAKAEDRRLREAIKARQEPLWRILAHHPHPHLKRMAVQRPKFLRGVHAELLARVVFHTQDEVSAEVAAVAVAQKDTNALYSLTHHMMDAARMWVSEHPNQLREQLKRVGAYPFLTNAEQWLREGEAKEELEHAGQKIGELDVGDLRLMDSEQFEALSEYLDCCIGNEEEYLRRANHRVSAFVCLYSTDRHLPFGLAELKYERGAIRIGETQSRMDRDDSPWIESLERWTGQPDAAEKIAHALGVTMGLSITAMTGSETAEWSWWEEGNALSPWGATLTIDWDGLVEACLSAEVSFRDAVATLDQYATAEQLAAFQDAMSCAVRSS